MANYQYPATIESNGEGGFIASFRDVPEAITEAWDLEELKTMHGTHLLQLLTFTSKMEEYFPQLLIFKLET